MLILRLHSQDETKQKEQGKLESAGKRWDEKTTTKSNAIGQCPLARDVPRAV